MVPVIDAILTIGTKLIESWFPNKEEQEKRKAQLIELQLSGALKELEAEVQMATGQMEVNKIEAASDSLFKSGWRPAVGWLGVFGLAWSIFIMPTITWITPLWYPDLKPPTYDTTEIVFILSGLLGVGTVGRSFEKVKALVAPIK